MCFGCCWTGLLTFNCLVEMFAFPLVSKIKMFVQGKSHVAVQTMGVYTGQFGNLFGESLLMCDGLKGHYRHVD